MDRHASRIRQMLHDFHECLQAGGLGPYPGGGGGRGAEGKYRQQPYPNDSGARWSRGHPLEQQRTPPPGHGLGIGGYANPFPGGRGHDGHHLSGGRGRGRGEGFGKVPPPHFSSISTPNISPNLPPRQFSNAPRHAFEVDYPY